MMRWRFPDSEAVFNYLMGFVNVEKGQKTEFKLDRMRSLCEALGHPEQSYRTIHVAGSKGKGSVSVMIARILEAKGLKTGLYTSPHLIAWKERISLAGEEMPEDIILAAMDELMPLVDGKGPADFVGGELPTYFELTTLVGFLAFRLADCDVAVIETGMGGRLDSTNVIESALSVITPIELEHTEWLGDTIPKIAFEKAGIIKPGKPCIVSHQRPDALEVFREACATRNSRLIDVEKAAAIGNVELGRNGTTADIRIADDGLAGFGTAFRYRTPLVGSVQAENMALAILAARVLEPGLSPAEARLGLLKSRLPARFEVLDAEPAIVLDGAHTPASIALCLESFNAIFPGPADLVFACAHDKKHEEMAKILDGRFRCVTVTKPGNFKQSEPERVAASFGLGQNRCRLIIDTGEALATAREDAKKAGLPLLIAGSFYLCSEAARLFE